MRTTTQLPEPAGSDRTTALLYRVADLFAEHERHALSDAHRAIIEARDQQPKRRWYQRKNNTVDLRPGLSAAAELVAAKLAGVDKT